MRRLLAAIVLSVAPLAAIPPAAAHDADEAHVLTILASPEPQTQLMALILTQAAIASGAEARVLLCGPAADLALQDPPEAARTPLEPRGMSPQGLLVRLKEAGVPVAVCAIYLPNLGAGPEVLFEGIGVATPPEVTGYMLSPGVRLLTF